MAKELTKAIQEIMDSLNGDGVILIPPGWYFIDLKIPLGVYVYGI